MQNFKPKYVLIQHGGANQSRKSTKMPNQNPNHQLCNQNYPMREQLAFLTSIDTHPKKQRYYQHLLEKNTSYPSVKSDAQIKTVVNSGFHNISRLVILCHEVLGGIPCSSIYDLFRQRNKSDSHYYSQLYRMWKRGNRIKNPKQTVLSQSDYIARRLGSENISIQGRYLDIGCGMGWKAVDLGRALNIKQVDIFGADIADWFGLTEKRDDRFTFIPLTPNMPLNIETNSLQLISMMHSLHHIKDIEYRLEDCYRMLQKDGYIILMEHDVFFIEDFCIADIEHALYERVRENKKNEFLKNHYANYRNWVEIDILMKKAKFQFVSTGFYDRGNNKTVISPSKTYIAIYKKL